MFDQPYYQVFIPDDLPQSDLECYIRGYHGYVLYFFPDLNISAWGCPDCHELHGM